MRAERRRRLIEIKNERVTGAIRNGISTVDIFSTKSGLRKEEKRKNCDKDADIQPLVLPA